MKILDKARIAIDADEAALLKRTMAVTGWSQRTSFAFLFGSTYRKLRKSWRPAPPEEGC